MGDGTLDQSNFFVPVSDLTDVVNVATGYGHSLAVLSSGFIMGWGWNAYFQLGINEFINSTLPVEVPGIINATQVSAGFGHSVALIGKR